MQLCIYEIFGCFAFTMMMLYAESTPAKSTTTTAAMVKATRVSRLCNVRLCACTICSCVFVRVLSIPVVTFVRMWEPSLDFRSNSDENYSRALAHSLHVLVQKSLQGNLCTALQILFP
jgi:hypothetical protein